MSNMYLINVVVVTILSFSNIVKSQTTLPPTSSGCPGGGVAYQDIAILYELSYFPDNSSMAFSQQISNAISSKLFSGSTYQYYQADGITRATQITPIPFPYTMLYNPLSDYNNYGVVKSQYEFVTLLGRQLNDAQRSGANHPTESKISAALEYLIKNIQRGKRPPPVKNTIVIIAKRDSDVSGSLPDITRLKSNGSKIMTIGVGNASLSNLQTLSSGDGYNFLIPDITDANTVDSVSSQIASKLITDCGITWFPATTTTPMTTTPYTGTTTTTTPGRTTTTMSTTPYTGSTTTPISTIPTTTLTTPGSTTTGTGTSPTVSVTGTTAPSATPSSTPSTPPTSTIPPTTTAGPISVSTTLASSTTPPTNTSITMPSSTVTSVTDATASSPTTSIPPPTDVPTTPASTPSTTPNNQYKDNGSSMPSFSSISFLLILSSFIYTFANYF
uniref:VWFA domain-containing protein n=1 Tax=Panagrolaimus sp. ES5 TaxID=591445 RepID=A0AC34GQ44_9BILA